MDTKKPDTGAPDFTKEEVQRRALETARRMLNTPPKPKSSGIPPSPTKHAPPHRKGRGAAKKGGR